MNRRAVNTGDPEFQSRAPQDSPARPGGLLFDARQLAAYVVYVARTFKAFHLVVAMTLLALVLEYAATSLMIPLAPGNIAAESAVTAFWTRVAAVFGLEPVPRTWLWLFVIVLLLVGADLVPIGSPPVAMAADFLAIASSELSAICRSSTIGLPARMESTRSLCSCL
jgi:hypothetical protein